MKAYLFARQGATHQSDAMRALNEGLIRHGIRLADSIEDADFTVWWGDVAPPHARGKPYLVLEAGYINGHSDDYVRDRLRFISGNWNGLHGRASRAPSGCPPDRWNSLGLTMKPWRLPERRVTALVCGQHPGDRNAPPSGRWLTVCERARAHFDVVVMRQHPLIEGDQPPIEVALQRADVAITWNSNSAVECVIEGVPTITLDRGSIAWQVTSHRIEDPLRLADRAEWGYNLAYRQWRHHEFANGTAWEWLQYGIADHNGPGSGTSHA